MATEQHPPVWKQQGFESEQEWNKHQSRDVTTKSSKGEHDRGEHKTEWKSEFYPECSSLGELHEMMKKKSGYQLPESSREREYPQESYRTQQYQEPQRGFERARTFEGGGYGTRGYEQGEYGTRGYEGGGYGTRGYETRGYEQGGYGSRGYEWSGQPSYSTRGFETSRGFESPRGYEGSRYEQGGYGTMQPSHGTTHVFESTQTGYAPRGFGSPQGGHGSQQNQTWQQRSLTDVAHGKHREQSSM